MEKKGLFDYLPVSLFGSVMGLSGLSIAWSLAYKIYGKGEIIAHIIAILAVLAFIAIFIAYLLKIITSFKSFYDEFKNPVLRSFFGTFNISLLLLPIVIYPYFPVLAEVLWIIGVVLMLLFAWYVVSSWISLKHEMLHITPAWIIPVVGTLDIPLASNLFNYDWIIYLNIFCVAIGLFFAVPIFTLIFTRILFFERLPDKLMPSLLIMIAPFSVGFSAYLMTNNANLDIFAFSLFFLGLFIFLVLLPQLISIFKSCPFRVTWWAVSFPLSALLVSTLKINEDFDNVFINTLSWVFLVAFTLIILWLFIRTLKGVFDGELKNLS